MEWEYKEITIPLDMSADSKRYEEVIERFLQPERALGWEVDHPTDPASMNREKRLKKRSKLVPPKLVPWWDSAIIKLKRVKPEE